MIWILWVNTWFFGGVSNIHSILELITIILSKCRWEIKDSKMIQDNKNRLIKEIIDPIEEIIFQVDWKLE